MSFWRSRAIRAKLGVPEDAEGEAGMAVFLGGPAAVSCSREGVLEFVAMRNARKEKAFYVLPFPGNPAAGEDCGAQTLEYALCFTGTGDWRDNRLPRLCEHALYAPWRDERLSRLVRDSGGVCETDNEEVSVLAVKRALRGDGLVVRLYSPLPVGGEAAVALQGRGVGRAFLCDGRERDLEEVTVRDGMALVSMRGSITTVRILA